MASKTLTVFSSEQKVFAEVGKNLFRARKRRSLSAEAVAARASISRQTLYRIERGDPATSLGLYYRVAIIVGLNHPFDTEDPVGRRLQDDLLGKEPESPPTRSKAKKDGCTN
jgi:transcriptional regulator with XRE-family HTH domain